MTVGKSALEVRVNWQFTTEDARVRLKRLYPNLLVDWTLDCCDVLVERVENCLLGISERYRDDWE